MPLVAVDDSEPKVTIIIPNLNGMDYLPACLSSAVAECKALGCSAAVLVVDNGSIDGSVDFIRRAFQGVGVLPLGENRGFAEACDRGILAAQSEYCFLLNNDAWFEHGTLAHLLDFAMRHGHAVAGPAILNPDGSPQWGPLSIDFIGHPAAMCPGTPPFLVVGVALLLRRQDYLRLGGFDRRFFAYYEETDLQWRAHLYGLSVGYDPEAHVYHVGRGTEAGPTVRVGELVVMSWQRQYLARRNQLASLLINYASGSLLWVLPLCLLLTGIECFGMIVTGHIGQVRAYVAAVAWNGRHLPGTLRRRWTVQASRRVPDREIRRLFAPPLGRLRMLLALARSGTRVRMV